MNVRPGVYQHFRNGLTYEVITVARHSETKEDLVVYRAIYFNAESEYWVRPYEMFTQMVEYNGKMVPRFRWVGESDFSRR